MMANALRWLLAAALLGLFAVPTPVAAHNSHQTATVITCSPNPVNRGQSTTCTLRVNDIASSQNAQPSGTMRLYRGSFDPANLLASCTVGGVPNATASSCTVTYTPLTTGTETLIADFVNTATGSDPHNWCSSTQTTGGCGGTTRGTTSLTINPAPAAALRIVPSPSGQPTNTTAGVAIQRAGGGGIQVEVLNSLGERITSGAGSTLSVTMAIQTNPGGGTLSGTLTVNAVSGVATFSNLSINRAGNGYALRATGSNVTAVTTTAFNINAAAANRFAFAQQPTSVIAGQVIGGAPGVTVRVEDQFGNVVATDNTTQVTVALASNPTSATLGGTLTASAVNGVASFLNLTVNTAGTGYTLQGTGSLTTATSIAFDIAAGTESRVRFGTQPGNISAGQTLGGGAVTARIEDAFGNLITSSAAPVTVALTTNPTMTTLQGTLTVNAVSGVATFTNLSITRAGVGYRLTLSSSGLLNHQSDLFTVSAGAATRLAYGQPPTNNELSQPITPAVTVRIEDVYGNVVNDTRAISIAFDTNPGAATLVGTTTRNAIAGVATFNDLQINTPASGYRLSASASGLASAISAPFAIANGVATQLAFDQQPTNSVAGSLISPTITVRILDAGGTLVNSTQAVTLAIGNNPSGGTLSGTVTVNAVNGVASFSSLSVNTAGSGYTLNASATSLAGATSSAFNVSTSTASRLRFAQQPSNAIAGTTIAGALGGVTVRVEDASGNLVATSSNAVTLSIDFDAGGIGTVLNGTVTVNAVNGIATFPNLSIQRVGVGYTLRAASGSLTNDISAGFNITHGAAAKLGFNVHPSNVTAGNTITPAVTVRVLDAFDNLVANSTIAVALSIASNPGGGVLGGNAAANAVGGTATFNNLFINRAGAGYTLAANAAGLTGATSNAFNVAAGAASRLGFITQPTNTPLLQTITPAVRVAVQDGLGNTITTSTASVSLVIGNNPTGADLGGATTVNAVSGIATFSGLTINRTGVAYTLLANASGLSSGTSSAFNITVGAPAKLAFIQQPQNTAPGTVMVPWPSVQVQDAAGNPVSSTATITITRNNPGTCAGVLSGTTAVAATDGVSTFSTLQISANGTNCTLVASATGLTAATSNAFNVVTPSFTFTGLTPTIGPTGGGTVVSIYGSGFGSQIGRYSVVFGTSNPAPPVTATRLSNSEIRVDSPAHVPGLVNVIVIDNNDGAMRALQNAYTYIAQPAVKLLFNNQPTNIVAGGQFTPRVTVQVSDANGNLVSNATNTITIAFHENIPGGVLLGTKSVAAFNGVATFTDLSVDKVGTGYTLIATAGGLTDTPPSNAFSVTAGPPAKLAFGQQPTNNDPGTAITPAITVQVQDANGNLVTTADNAVSMAIGINAGAGALTGGVSVAASDGVATFNTLAIDKAGNGYTLIATAGGLTQAESATFDIRFGAPARVTVTTHPGNGVAGAALTPAIVAQVEDALGNVVSDYNGAVTIALHTNPGGSTLSGTLSVTAVNGIATLSNVVLNRVGTGYRLAASGFGLAAGLTNLFDITNNVAAGLQFSVHPTDTSQGAVISPAVEVRVVDAFGNPVPNATNTVALALAPSGTLGGTTSRAAVGGIASFNNLTVGTAGDGFTLVATSSGLTQGTSLGFNVIGVGGTFNIFAPATPAGNIVGYLPTIVAGEDFCVDIVKINGAGTAPEAFTSVTITLQLIDASINTGSLQPGSCRSSWTVVQEWKGIAAAPGDGSRINVCAGLQGPVGSQVLNNLRESNVWPNLRFRAFTTSGNAGIGCSTDAFAMRPDFFELSSIEFTDEDWQTAGVARNLVFTGTASASGGRVHAAGRPFRAQVTAINSQGQPTTNYDGKPRIEVIERLLPATCTGCPTPTIQSSGWGQSASVPGAVRSNQVVYNDVGSLRVRIVDETFSAVDQLDIDLGLQPADAGVIVSVPVNIGRFVPDNFVVAPTSTPQLRTQGIDPLTCAGSRAFTYIGQSFGYANLPSAQISARSANGAVTPGYRNELWKLTPSKVQQEYSDNTNPANAATLDTSLAPLVAGNATLTSNNDGTGVLTVNSADRLSYQREALIPAGDPLTLPNPPLPFDAFISLTLRVYDDAETGVTGNAQINTGTPGVFSNMAFDSGNEFRYGRLRLINTVGSELEPLEMPYRFQTWQDVGNDISAWVTESDDNCTALSAGNFSTLNVQNTNPDAGALNLTGFTVSSPPAAGEGKLTFNAQNAAVTGSFDVFGGAVPSYLWFNWTNDPGGADEGPTAKGAFGVNEGNPRRIFRTQSFTPRSSGTN